ncbi:MAG: 6-carboxytetrahydropterin synthase [Helicobacteraceae bacterium]|jgi:6-pyruvoyltetrahydropterin/6-carboxytetrahydropterin synthase|nr:6-carboxytetrahydropterin synthase [Helicobacteraceae bacterium]
MIIRKLFRFENAHIVRGALDKRCAKSIHGHSYKVEVLLQSKEFSDGQMVLDFTLVKELLGWFIDAFDHSVAIWKDDKPEYIEAIKHSSDRWVVLPVNPSAEQFARVIFWFSAAALENKRFVEVSSVIVHETEGGYAQAFAEDVNNSGFGALNPREFLFSEAIIAEWGGTNRFARLFHIA